MAHECPACGLTCYCNGDIGDMCLNSPENQDSCIHCDDNEDEEYRGGMYLDDDPEGAGPEDNKEGREYEQTKREGG